MAKFCARLSALSTGNENMNSIGERLRSERSRLGMNQDELAKVGGVQRSAQSNYERGDRSPDATYLALVAAAGVDVLYVVTGEKKPTMNELALHSDAWEALDRALQRYQRNLSPEKKRRAADLLFEALKEGKGDAQDMADLVIRAA